MYTITFLGAKLLYEPICSYDNFLSLAHNILYNFRKLLWYISFFQFFCLSVCQFIFLSDCQIVFPLFPYLKIVALIDPL